MKRPTEATFLGLTLLVTISIMGIPGCRGAEKKLSVAKGNVGDQVIEVSLTNPPPGVQVPADKNPVEVSYKNGNKIVWVFDGEAPMSIVFKDPQKDPFPKLKCSVGNGLSVCSSGPIGKYKDGKDCHDPDDPDARCFDYKVCLVLAPHTDPVCTNDPGIIIHP